MYTYTYLLCGVSVHLNVHRPIIDVCVYWTPVQDHVVILHKSFVIHKFVALLAPSTTHRWFIRSSFANPPHDKCCIQFASSPPCC